MPRGHSKHPMIELTMCNRLPSLGLAPRLITERSRRHLSLSSMSLVTQNPRTSPSAAMTPASIALVAILVNRVLRLVDLVLVHCIPVAHLYMSNGQCRPGTTAHRAGPGRSPPCQAVSSCWPCRATTVPRAAASAHGPAHGLIDRAAFLVPCRPMTHQHSNF
nr:unnamed protein product [Digitaria exilis]